MRIFISYARINRPKVEELQAILIRAGYEAWFDKEISGGEDWWRSIVTSIQSCDVFLFALSPESTNSEACRAEYQYALDLNKPILPVMLKNAELPIGKLLKTHHVKVKNLKNQETILELVRALTRLGESIKDGKFPPPNPIPPYPSFPFAPDPFEDIPDDLRGLTEEELLKIVYKIRQTARSSKRTASKARELLQKIANSASLPYGVVELAKTSLPSIPSEENSRRLHYIISAIVIFVLVLFILYNIQKYNNFLMKVTNSPSDAAFIASSTPQVTASLTLTQLSTNTPSFTSTFTITPTFTATPTATKSLTNTPTFTYTDTPIVESSLTLTRSVVENLRLTQTATAFTATPSLTPTATISATPRPPISAENAASVKEISPPLGGHNSTIRKLTFSPDGSLFASGSSDFTVRVWDVETKQMVWRIAESTDWITGIAFSPDGRLLAIASTDGSIQIWDVESRLRLHMLNRTPVWDVVFSPDSNILAFGLNDSSIELWDIPSETTLAILQGHEKVIQSLDFNNDGSLLVTGGLDGTVRLWDIVAGEEILTFEPRSSGINLVKFSPDGLFVAAGNNDGVARVWSVNDSSRIAAFAGGRMWAVDFSPDGQVLAVASQNQSIYLWEWASNKPPKQLTGHATGVRSLAFSPSGSILVSGDEEYENTIRLWGVSD